MQFWIFNSKCKLITCKQVGQLSGYTPPMIKTNKFEEWRIKKINLKIPMVKTQGFWTWTNKWLYIFCSLMPIKYHLMFKVASSAISFCVSGREKNSKLYSIVLLKKMNQTNRCHDNISKRTKNQNRSKYKEHRSISRKILCLL